MNNIWLLLFLLINFRSFSGNSLHLISANPDADNQNCASRCSGVLSHIGYTIGQTYMFDVSSESTVKFWDTGHRTQVRQNFGAEITAISKCEFALQIRGVRLAGMEVPSIWAQQLESKQLLFGFDNGEVTSICPSQDDPVWAVNFKRAVLSVFQTIDEIESETDISGKCLTKRSKKRSGNSVVIESIKNVTSCERANTIQKLRSVSYRRSGLEAVESMQSTQKCVRTISDSILQAAECSEIYEIKEPFDNSKSLISTNTMQRLRYTGKRGSAAFPTPQVQKNRRTLIYENTNDLQPIKGNFEMSRSLISSLCQPGITVPEAAQKFSDLVINLRSLTSREIATLGRTDCEAFVDATAACATPECVGFLTNLVRSNQVSSSIFSSLAFVPNPQIETINHIASIIQILPTKELLGVSSVVQSYCLHNANCMSEASVNRIIDTIMRKFDGRCGTVQHAEINELIIALKSIGNIGYEQISLSALSRCISTATNSIVKITAIDALRRKPCSDTRNSIIEQLYNDQKEDAEIRISAFRQLMECPEKFLQQICHKLENETSNQVGSYVWSYLNALSRSTNPSYQNIKRLLSQYHISSEFEKDPRRFSRFYDFGFFDEQENIGAHMDSSIIFNPKGFIPRQVAFNISVHFYGNSINIMEIGAHAQGLEAVGDELFGTDGYVTNSNGYLFRKRKFPPKSSLVAQRQQIFIKNEDMNLVTGGLYMRMFGDDLHYCSFHDKNFLSNIKESMNLGNIFKNVANERSLKYSKNAILLDIARVTPSLTGLPLRFSLRAAASVKFDNKIKLNFADLLRVKANFDTMFDLRPSTSFFVEASLTLHAENTAASGMRISSAFHAATNVNGNMELQNGKLFKSKINLPDTKPFAVHISAGAAKIDNGRFTEIIGRAPEVNEKCTPLEFGKITGLKGCLKVENRKPGFASIISVEKVDPLLQNYEMIIGQSIERDETKFVISFDTPGSSINRKIEAKLAFVPRKSIQLGLTTPFKKFLVEGMLDYKADTTDADVKLSIDDQITHRMKGNLKEIKRADGAKYELQAGAVDKGPNAPKLAATIDYSIPKRFIDVDFNLNNVLTKPVILKSLISAMNNKYEAKLEYSEVFSSGKLATSIIRSGIFNFDFSLNGEYELDQSKKKYDIIINGEQKIQKGDRNFLLKQMASVASRLFPKIDYQLSLERKDNDIEKTILMTYGRDTFSSQLKCTKSPNELYTINHKLKCDRFDMDNNMNIVYQNRFPQQFRIAVNVDTKKLKNLAALAEYEMKVNPKLVITGHTSLTYPGKKISATHTMNEIESGQYKTTTVLEWSDRSTLTIDSTAIFRPKNNEYSINALVKAPWLRTPINIIKKVQGNFFPDSIARYLKFVNTDNRNDRAEIFWQVQHGRKIIYELSIRKQGHYGGQQRFNLEVKSDQLQPRIHYEMIGDFHPSNDELKINAVVKKDAQELIKSTLSFPTMRKQSPKYQAVMDWNYQNRQHHAMLEYKRDDRNAKGPVYELNAESNKDMKMGVKLQFHDRILLKCDIEKNGRLLSSSEVKINSLRLDDFNMEFVINTDHPLPRKMAKGKAIINYKSNEVLLETWFELDGDRYLTKGNWRKDITPGTDDRHYIYLLQILSPKAGLTFDQQIRIQGPTNLNKIHTSLKMDMDKTSYTVKNRIDRSITTFDVESEFIGDRHNALHRLNYLSQDGERTLKNLFKHNNKEFSGQVKSIYKDRIIHYDVDITSSHPALKVLKSETSCNKEQEHWNCRAEFNLNDRYTGNAYESLARMKAHIGYKLSLNRLYDGGFELNYDFSQPNTYITKILINHIAKQFQFLMNVVGSSGTITVETPKGVTKYKGIKSMPGLNSGFKITADEEGNPRGRVEVDFVPAEPQKMFRLQILGTEQPLEIILKNELSDRNNVQTTTAQVIFDPMRKKEVYGVTNVLESSGKSFKGMKTTIQHPKRVMYTEILRPAYNKYLFHFHPNKNGRRKPTVAEFSYEKLPMSFLWQGSFSDEALSSPVHLKIDAKRYGNDINNYGFDIKGELDYSGEPDKLFKTSIHADRRVVNPGANQTVKFDFEMERTHIASNLHCRLFAKFDRREINGILVPVSSTLGVSSKNKQGIPVVYKLETDSDAKSYLEMRTQLGQSNMKARIDRSENDFQIAIYKDSNKASLLGDIRIMDNGFQVELRDEKSDEVKLHGSAQIINDYNGYLELWHNERGRKIVDTNFRVEIHENNMLTASISLRPDLDTDFMKATNDALSVASNYSGNSIIKDIVHPVIDSHKLVINDISSRFSGLGQSWLHEQRLMASDFGIDASKLTNEIEEIFEIVHEAILVTNDQAKQIVEEQLEAFSKGEIMEQLRQLKQNFDLPKYIIEPLKPLSNFLDMLQDIVNKIRVQSSSAMLYIKENLKVDEFLVELSEYKKKITEADYVQAMLDKTKAIMKKYQTTGAEQAVIEFEKKLPKYRKGIAKIYEKVRDTILSKAMAIYFAKLTEVALRPFTQGSVDSDNLREKWFDIINYLRQQSSYSEDFWKKYIPVVQRTSPAEYTLEMLLPFPGLSLRDAIDILNPSYLSAKSAALVELFGSPKIRADEFGQSLLNSIYTFKMESIYPSKILPPYKSVGYIIDNDKFITFDGRIFAFNAPCEYVLAVDLVDHQAEFVASFDAQGLNVLKMEFRELPIFIYRDGKIEADRRPISLPWQRVDKMDGESLVSIKKEGDWILLKTYDGHHVHYNEKYKVWEIGLSGRMHAKIGGLLGLNDNEPVNDLDFTDGRSNNLASALAQHWLTAGSCNRNQANLGSGDIEECEKLFVHSTSPFVECFSKVYSSPFGRLCPTSMHNDHCVASAAYAQTCRNAGVKLSLPSECVTCEPGFKKDEEKKIMGPDVGHDIVFVVEERTCMDRYKDKIERVVHVVAQKWRNAQFGWVGFGGEGSFHSPSIHYIGGSALMGVSELIQQLRRKYEPESGIEQPQTFAMDAVHYAVQNFPFRSRSAKSIILVICKTCDSRTISKSDLLDALLKQGIKFHVLSLRKIKTSTNVEPVGFDANDLFDERGGNIGNQPKLISTIDDCSMVAQEAHGTSFNLKRGSSISPLYYSPRQGDCVLCQCVEDSFTVRTVCHPCQPIEAVQVALGRTGLIF